MKLRSIGLLALGAALSSSMLTPATAADKQPNIIMIMGDDIGWSNIGVYNQGIMAGRTPNLDQLATGHALHRLLRRSELHCRPRQFHHRRTADPHGHDDGWPGRLADRHAGAGANDRHGAQGRWAMPPDSSARTISAI